MFERFPYTNFHDMNLDWILKQVKVFGDKLALTEQAVNEIPNMVKAEAEKQLADKNIDAIVSDYVSRATTHPHRNCKRNFRIVRKNMSALSGGDSGYYAQGFCTDGESCYFAMIDVATNICTIVKTDMSGNVLAENTIGDSHANDMTVYNGRLYVLNMKNVDEVLLNTVTVLSLSTLAILDTVDSSVVNGAYGIAHDRITGKLYLAKSGTLYEVEENLHSFYVKSERSIEHIPGAVQQSLTVHNNVAIIMTVLPDCLTFVNLDSGLIIENYTPPAYISNTWQYGELEGVDIGANGNILFTGICRGGQAVEYHMTQLFELEYSNSFPENIRQVNHGGEYLTIAVNVNSAYTNPDGENAPFRYLFEAALYSASPYCKQYPVTRITIGGTGYAGSVDFSNSTNISLLSQDTVKIGNLVAFNASNIEILRGVFGVGSTDAIANMRFWCCDNICLKGVGLVDDVLQNLIDANSSTIKVRNILTDNANYTLYNPATQNKTLWNLNNATIDSVSSSLLRGVKLNNVRSSFPTAPIIISTGFDLTTGSVANFTDFSLPGNDPLSSFVKLGYKATATATLGGLLIAQSSLTSNINLFAVNIANSEPYDVHAFEVTVICHDSETVISSRGKNLTKNSDETVTGKIGQIYLS